MTERREGATPVAAATNETLWAVMKELAAVSRAQARLTRRLCDLIEKLPRASAEPGPTETAGGRIHSEAHAEERADHAPPPAGAQRDEPDHAREAAPRITEFEEVVIEVDHPAAGNGGGREAIQTLAPPTSLEAPVGILDDAVGSEPREAAPAREEERISLAVTEAEGSAEGPDEIEESEGENEMVLTLESGDARVGVLWNQVVQIGSLSTATVPDRIGIDRDEVKVVSLGNLLHGVSREEKYFVILMQDGERVGVACEKMLGLGPLAEADKREGEPRIQVLKVPFLLTSRESRKEGMEAGARTTQTAEEQDKQGPLRALVAVRYLPARVALCRHLRGRGWQVGEAAGLEAATVSLDLGRWDALFLETHSNGESDEIESTLLRRVLERQVPVIRVGSRISGYSGQDGPALMFPFSEAELDAILVQAGRRVTG